MTAANELFDDLLDSSDRANRILVNLLDAIPMEQLAIRATESSPSIAQLFTHIHHVRLIFIAKDAPELELPVPKREWLAVSDPDVIARMLSESAAAVQARRPSARRRCDRAGHVEPLHRQDVKTESRETADE